MKNLTIYFTSDTHGSVYPTDYTDTQIKDMGLLAVASSIHKDKNTLIIDGGDTIQGSPFSTYILDKSFDKNPMSQVMNMVGYDYITLGNHDFNYGYEYLMDYLGHIKATVLCANVEDTSNGHAGLIKNTAIHTLDNGVKVGLVGLTTDYIKVWEKPEHLTNFNITDPFPAAKEALASLKGKVDLLVGIYHGGFENDVDSHKSLSSTSENIAYKLSKELDFDLLLTGHQHIPMCGKSIFNTHFVQTPMSATKYAKVSVEVDDANKLSHIDSELLTPVPDISDANAQVYGYMQNDIQLWLDKYVGKLDTLLEATDHITAAQEGSSIANFLNQIQLDASGADVSCTSLANKVLGLPKEVTLRDIVSTYIYPNTLIVLEVTGDILKKALERSAEYFEVTEDGVKVSEIFMKPKVEHYNYDYFSGIDYTFDLTKPLGQRVVSILHKGVEVEPDQKLTLVMNNYRSSGTGGYEFYTTCPVKADIQISTNDLVSDYIKRHPVVEVDKTVYVKVIK